MKIYIACALTHVPRPLFQEYADFIHHLAQQLRESPVNAVVSYALANSDPQLARKPADERARLCYLWDKEMVDGADVIVAEASFPSTGLGIEMQIAASDEKPLIVCYRDYGENKAAEIEYKNPDQQSHKLQIGRGIVSLMALGIPSVFSVVEYSEERDGIQKILNAICLLQKDRSS